MLWLIAEFFLFSQKFFLFTGAIALVLSLIWGGITYIRKKRIMWEQISFLLSVLGLGVVVVSILLNTIPWRLYFKEYPLNNETPDMSLTVSENPPDIYYIILDAYSRSDILKVLYGFDNSDFLNFLDDHGFILPEDNHSNYPMTVYSIASTLNMQYINNLMPELESWHFGWRVAPLVKDSQVRRMLEGAGYTSVSIHVDWVETNVTDTDVYLKPILVEINTFEKLLIQKSPLKLLSPILDKFVILNTYPSHRKSINYSLEALSDATNIKNPKFVYAHIESPHPPFVFDADGQAVTPTYEFSFSDGNATLEDIESYKKGYIGQLQYINKRLETAIDMIIEKSESPPIIILISDHGSRLLTDFNSDSQTCYWENLSNFAAFYLPGVDPEVIPSDITSVNVFRVLFNQYFEANMDMLDNEYYSFRFEDTSELINQKCDWSYYLPSSE